ncbi:hypothetical protein HAX54_014998 [Datura stramonium]|uniref:Uncharacterized protein n=1 Tax=Datura stramonium TaxID=4076 RepID=A0ABS8TNW9_DATST|nr:hypothetical protein [Datura stramonium]
MPNMMKRAINKAIALVHVKIQYLEHRVSELEGIGARERSMDDVTAWIVGASPSSHAPAGEDVATIETTTSAQSEEAKDT